MPGEFRPPTPTTKPGAPRLASETWETAPQYPESRPGRLLGMISDGDLRRLLERDGSHALEHTAAEIMNPNPRTIQGSALASTALAMMEEKKITSLIVITAEGHAEGVVHLHDLWALQLN